MMVVRVDFMGVRFFIVLFLGLDFYLKNSNLVKDLSFHNEDAEKNCNCICLEWKNS